MITNEEIIKILTDGNDLSYWRNRLAVFCEDNKEKFYNINIPLEKLIKAYTCYLNKNDFKLMTKGVRKDLLKITISIGDNVGGIIGVLEQWRDKSVTGITGNTIYFGYDMEKMTDREYAERIWTNITYGLSCHPEWALLYQIGELEKELVNRG